MPTLDNVDLLLDVHGDDDLLRAYRFRIRSTIMATGGVAGVHAFAFLTRLTNLQQLVIIIHEHFQRIASPLSAVEHIDIVQGSELGRRESAEWWRGVTKATEATLEDMSRILVPVL
jgi:hypothetical protein